MKDRVYVTPADEDVDDAPEMTEWGWAVNKPGFDEDDALETLEEDEFGEGEMDSDPEAILPPQEAYDAMTFMAPLSDEEEDLLDEVPGLVDRGGGPLMFVDDADHEQWIRQAAKNGTHGIDRALEDAMYGDDEIGLRLRLKKPRFVKKIGKGLKKIGKTTGKGVKRTGKVVGKTAKKVGKTAVALTKGFDPRRDAGKAKMIRGLNAKLIKERANFLQASDLKRGVKKPRAGYEATAKLWARNKIQGAGLPVSMKGESLVAGMIKGDVMGAWYNPASWFKGKTKYVLETTEGERLAVFNPSEYAAYTAAKLAQRGEGGEGEGEGLSEEAESEPVEEYTEEDIDSSEMEGSMLGNDELEYDFVVGDEDEIDGESDDTLGQFATEILGEGEITSDESGAWLHKLNPAYWVKSKRERKFIDAEKNQWDENYKLQKRLKEQRKELDAGRRAVHATSTASRVKDEAAAIDAELKSIEASVDGVGSDFVGEFVGAVRKQNAKNHKLAKMLLAAAAKRGGTLSPRENNALRNVVKKHLKVKKARKSVLSGENPVEILGDDAEYDFVVGAANRSRRPVGKKTWVEMTTIATTNPAKLNLYFKTKGIKPTASDLKHLANLVALTKKTVVRGEYGDDLSGDKIGSAWKKIKKVGKKAGAIAILPAAALAYGTYKGGKYAGQKLGIVKKKKSAVAARQSRMNAAQKKRIAALKRREVALAKTAEARAEAEAVAAAADAEAAAAAAEMETEAAEIEAQEAEFTPEGEGEGEEYYDEADMEGEPMTLTQGDFVGAWVGAVSDPKEKKIVAAAATNTPLGKKIRAGATVVKKAKAGDVKAKVAVAKIVQKSKAGDPQAKRDLNALKAGKVALQAKGKAGKKIAVKTQSDRIVAGRSRLEAKAGDKLAQLSRKRQLSKIATVERAAAKGNPKAKAAIAKTVAKAQKGDPKAKTTVAALTLAKRVRTAAKTPREAKNLSIAAKTLSKARKGNRRAIQTIAVTKAAAQQGQPNAKRAMERLKTAQAVERAVATGKVVPPAKKLTGVEKKKAVAKTYTGLKSKVVSGRATQEEAVAAAKLGNRLGLKQEAAALAMRAKSLPSKKQELKQAAYVQSAAKRGNAEAKNKLAEIDQAARAGQPAGINAKGKLVAAQTLQDVAEGRPMSRPVAEATTLIERQRAGDPEAARIIERAGQAAQQGDSNGVAAAVALTAASSILAASVAAPGAQKAFRSKAKAAAGMAVPQGEEAKASAEFYDLYAKVQKGDASRAEAERARGLAMGLGKPKLAAEISALMPPATQGTFGSAVLSAVSDPIRTYSEGVKSRSS